MLIVLNCVFAIFVFFVYHFYSLIYLCLFQGSVMQNKKFLALFLVMSSMSLGAHYDPSSSSAASCNACLDEITMAQPEQSAYVRAKKMIEEGQSPVLESQEDLEQAFAQAVDAKDVEAARKIGIEIKRQEDGIAINFISDNKIMSGVATVTIAVVIGVLSYLAKKDSSASSSSSSSSSASSSSAAP